MIITALGLSFVPSFYLVGAYYFGNLSGYGGTGNYTPTEYRVIEANKLTHTDSGRNLGTTWGGIETKAAYKLSANAALFETENPIFRGNNFNINNSLELTPISASINSEIEISPLPVVVLGTGGGLSTGWTVAGFNGLGRNFTSENTIRHESFSGVISRVFASAALQFDLGAVIPGKWTHIIAYAANKYEYRANSAASSDVAWEFEMDGGKNYNGVMRLGTYLLGYKIPYAINFIGLLATSEARVSHANDSPAATGGWASDFQTWVFGPVTSMQTENNNVVKFLLQWKYQPGYTDSSIGNRHFTLWKFNRAITTFHRVIMSWETKF